MAENTVTLIVAGNARQVALAEGDTTAGLLARAVPGFDPADHTVWAGSADTSPEEGARMGQQLWPGVLVVLDPEDQHYPDKSCACLHRWHPYADGPLTGEVSDGGSPICVYCRDTCRTCGDALQERETYDWEWSPPTYRPYCVGCEPAEEGEGEEEEGDAGE